MIDAGDRPSVRLEWLTAAHEVQRLAAVQESLPSLLDAFYWCADPYGADDNRQWLAFADAGRLGMREFIFAVMRADSGAFIGEAALDELDTDAGSANLSYWIRQRDRGQGFATMAAAAAARFAFHELGLLSLRVMSAVDNVASLRVIGKLGAAAALSAVVDTETETDTEGYALLLPPTLAFVLEAQHWPQRQPAGKGRGS